MEPETKEKQIEKRAGEITDAISGPAKDEPIDTESPLDEMRRLNKEMKEMIPTLQNLSAGINKEAANIILAGRSIGGQITKEKTQEEIDEEAAKEIVKRFKP